MRELRRECGQLGLDLCSFFETYDRWKTKILNYFDARQTSAAVEGINNKARVITKRTYGLKSAKSLWDRLILDLNRASQAIGYSIEHIRQMAKGLKALFDWSCDLKTEEPQNRLRQWTWCFRAGLYTLFKIDPDVAALMC